MYSFGHPVSFLTVCTWSCITAWRFWISFSNLKQMHQSFKFYVHEQCNHIIREMLDQTQTIWNLLHHQYSPNKTTLFCNIVLTQYKNVYSTQTLYSYISNINTRTMYVINWAKNNIAQTIASNIYCHVYFQAKCCT